MDFSDLDSMFGDTSKDVKILRELVEKLMELVITAMGEIETRFSTVEERLTNLARAGPPAVAPSVAAPSAPPLGGVPPPASISPPPAPGGFPAPPPTPGGLPAPPAAGSLQSDLSSAIEKRQTPGGMPPPPAPMPGGVHPPPAPGGAPAGGGGFLAPPPAQAPAPAPSGGLGLQAALKSELAEAFKKIRSNLDEE